MRQVACAVTGHRPSRFKFKYSEDYSLCKKIKRAMLEQFKRLYDEHGVRRYYVGGALGVDMWAGELILRLKEQPGYGDIELVVVLPFEGHDSKWDERSKRRMDFLLRMCSDCVVIGKEDCRENYIKRNCYMVDHADYLVAVYDNERNLRSGTMQTVRYAQNKGITISFVNPDTATVLGSGEINHIGPGEKSQYRPDENRQSRVASPPAVLFTRPVVGQPVSR